MRSASSVVFRVVIRDTRDAAVDVGATEIFRRHGFPGSRLYQRRTTQKDRSLIPNDNRLIAHCRNVSAAGRA